MTERRNKWAAAIVATPIFLLFAVLKVYGNHPAASDENIYFYMSVRTAFDGLWPYRDYFFPHPPLHVLIGVVVLRFAAFLYGGLHGSLAAGVDVMTSAASWSDGGLALSVAKGIPAASSLLAGFFIYKAARRAGAIEAVVATASFLFASQVLRASSHFTGIAEAAAFTAIGVASLLDGRDRLCGLAFAGGCLVAMYVAPAAAAAWLVILLISPRRALTVAVWAAVPLIVVHGLFALVAGEQYWRGLVLYHLKKPADVRAFTDAFWPLLYQNGYLFTVLPIALLAGALDCMGLLGFPRSQRAALPRRSRAERRREKHERTTRATASADAASAGASAADASDATSSATSVGAAIVEVRSVLVDLVSLARLRGDPRRQFLVVALAGAAATLLFLSRMNPVFEFYFVMFFVFAAMLAGYAYGAILRAGQLAAVAVARRRRGALSFVLAFVVLIAAAAVGEICSRADAVRRSEVDDVLVGLKVAWKWRPAARLGPVDALVRATMWTDEEVMGRRYASVTWYLWHESLVFDAPREAAAYARAETPPGATLFGDSYLAPLVALMSGRRLALDEADTNPMRFMSGITPPGDFVARLEREPPAVILADASILGRAEFANWIDARYQEVRALEDPGYDDVVLYRRRARVTTTD